MSLDQMRDANITSKITPKINVKIISVLNFPCVLLIVQKLYQFLKVFFLFLISGSVKINPRFSEKFP